MALKEEGFLIVELIGCSGTGKSTFREEIYNNLLSLGVNVNKPLEIFLGKTFANHITNEKLRNLFLDFLILPWSIISTVKHWYFFKYCIKIIKQDYSSLPLKIKLLRSISRKIGLYVFLNSFGDKKRPILVDEGTLHIAHLLFSNSDKNTVAANDIENFCSLVPTPDLIIHIMAPKSEIITRTIHRKDKPINETSPDALKRFIDLGFEVFNIINQLNPWGEKTIIFLNSDKLFRNLNDEALNIADKILHFTFPKR